MLLVYSETLKKICRVSQNIHKRAIGYETPCRYRQRKLGSKVKVCFQSDIMGEMVASKTSQSNLKELIPLQWRPNDVKITCWGKKLYLLKENYSCKKNGNAKPTYFERCLIFFFSYQTWLWIKLMHWKVLYFIV